MLNGTLRVARFHLTLYRRTWRTTTFTGFLMPLLYLGVVGIGAGSYVENDVEGFSYVQFLAPALLAVVAFQTAAEEAGFPLYAAIRLTHRYQRLLTAPLSLGQVLAGHLFFITVRAAVSAVVFCAVAALLGVFDSVLCLLLVPVAMLVALSAAAPLFAFTGRLTSSANLMTVSRLVVLPLSMFSGVFFPVGDLPTAVQPLIRISPLWHGVELCRGLSGAFMAGSGSGTTPLSLAGHLGVLLLWVAVGFTLTRWVFRRHLSD
ncbi:ABC transporter permease [Streptomyces sp. ID05-39B]|uniref:ABC transporter permease n=1 Tax=Streptomyces sp. ID05-39B TaxID=3028664 RepID=UPI0029BB4CFC|nr:ABC transporter permease [Streptomyces sp. ID05-39B]MDX3527248.1 ABC transporter permease [Streptomyces sp. ID05-39B]